MAECAVPTCALGPRASPLNRTMVLSKKSSRRPPGLPEASPPRTEIATKNMAEKTPMEAPHSNGQKEMNPTSMAPLKMPLLEKVMRPSSLLPGLQQILAESNVGPEWGERILEAAKANQNEWNIALEKSEQDRALCSQLFSLKLQAANKTAQKAMEFLQICEERGIDFDAILSGRPNSLLPQWRPRQNGHSPTNENCRRSPAAGDLEENEKLAQEREMLQSEVHSLEENYSNLFKLYERMRQNCVNLKETEQQLRADLEELGGKHASLHAKYMELLEEAQKKLDAAHDELERKERENGEKTMGIRFALKRAQIQAESLETALQIKSRENEELHQICNQLIAARDSAMDEEESSMKEGGGGE